MRSAADDDTGARASEPDGDVLGLVSAGNLRGAVDQLAQRYGTRVYRYCRDTLHDSALAEDVRQQVFIEVLQDLARFERRSTVRSWLFGIARHRVLDEMRRQWTQTQVVTDAAADAPDPRPSPADSVDRMQLHRALAASLAGLGERVRTAVLLRYQGFTFKQIAQLSGETPGALHARVTRALRQLRARFETHTPPPVRVGRVVE